MFIEYSVSANSDDNKLPRWFRSLQIASGIISLSLSVLAIVLVLQLRYLQ